MTNPTPPPPFLVAFGTGPLQDFYSPAQVFQYLDVKFAKHKRGCFSVESREAVWSEYLPLVMWRALCEDAEKFEMYFAIVGRPRQ